MSGLGVVELLKPLVDTKAWDYAVVWKFGDDPTRFMEWIGCCCSGSCDRNYKEKMNKPKMEEGFLAPICRDTLFQHPVRTKACEALAQIPLALSLYSGVHGEVALSQQPRWITQEDLIGTQVLIPVAGGLIELFASKLVPTDINMIEFITAHACVALKQEAISAQSYTTLNFNEHLPLREQYQQRWSPLSIERHSSSANPSIEQPSLDSKFVDSIPKTKEAKYNVTSVNQQRGLSSHCGDGEEDKSKLIRKPREEGYTAKNLVTERNRRNKIKNGLFTLRSLVPKITKMDRAAIVGDAIDYINELQSHIEELRDEIRALEVQDCEKNNTPHLRMQLGKEKGETRSVPLNELKQISSDCTEEMQMEVQVEVNQIGSEEFLIKLYCEQKQGGFSKLMEAIHSFGLQVANASVITFDGKVLNTLTVEATEPGIHPMKLREYLIQQIA